MKTINRKINFIRTSAKIDAAENIGNWCNFLGMPCGGCHFSVPPYDEDEGCFIEGVEVCAIKEIVFYGDKFKGYELPQEKVDELADRG